jgi:hypothetical protein
MKPLGKFIALERNINKLSNKLFDERPSRSCMHNEKTETLNRNDFIFGAHNRCQYIQTVVVLINMPIIMYISYMWTVNHALAIQRYPITQTKRGTLLANVEYILTIGIQPYMWTIVAYASLPFISAVLRVCYMFDMFYKHYEKCVRTTKSNYQLLTHFINNYQHLIVISDELNSLFSYYCLVNIIFFTSFASLLAYTIIADIIDNQLILRAGHLPNYTCMLLLSCMVLFSVTVPAAMLHERVSLSK